MVCVSLFPSQSSSPSLAIIFIDTDFYSATVSPGINFKRDTEKIAGYNHSDCEGSVAIPIFSSITFQNALVATLGKAFMNTTVPDNYTIPDWNSIS